MLKHNSDDKTVKVRIANGHIDLFRTELKSSTLIVFHFKYPGGGYHNHVMARISVDVFNICLDLLYKAKKLTSIPKVSFKYPDIATIELTDNDELFDLLCRTCEKIYSVYNVLLNHKKPIKDDRMERYKSVLARSIVTNMP